MTLLVCKPLCLHCSCLQVASPICCIFYRLWDCRLHKAFSFWISQHSGQHAGFFESHSCNRLNSEPASHFSSGSCETAKGFYESYHALEEELSRTVTKLGAVEQDIDIQKCI